MVVDRGRGAIFESSVGVAGVVGSRRENTEEEEEKEVGMK